MTALALGGLLVGAVAICAQTVVNRGFYAMQNTLLPAFYGTVAVIASLPVYLSRAGYRTARCGKYHVAPEEVYQFERVIPGPTRSPVVMANNCQTLISEESDKPFFLYICTSEPHRGGGQ